MTAALNIVALHDASQRDAAAVLTEAIERDFDTVFVVGIKDGNAHIKASRVISSVQALGAIELLKHNLLDNLSR